MQLQKSLLAGGLLLLLAACTYDNEEDAFGTPQDCTVNEARYSVQITSILQQNCYGCHSTNSNIGGLLLDSYSTARSAAASGLLLGTVRHEAGFSPMPKGGAQLPACDIAVLEKWVNDGMPNN